MPTFEVAGPGGATYEIEAPDEHAAAGAFQSLMSGGAGQAKPAKASPELTPSRAAGLSGRALVQAVPGMVAGLPALAYDAVQQAANWGYQGIDALAGTHLAEAHNRGRGGPMGTTRALGTLGEMGADALGLPEPATPGERVVVQAGQTAAEALGGAGLARAGAKVVGEAAPAVTRVLDELAAAPVAQTVVGGAAGGGAQVAQENGVNPLIGTGLGLVAGAGGVAAVDAARAAPGAAARTVNRTLARGEDVQRQIAEETVRKAASDPAAALRELDEGAGAELVPGSKPTTFQATGDMGLGTLERQVRTENPAAFQERAGEQNSARLASMRSLEGDGNASDVVSFLRSELDRIDQATGADETAARTRAEDAAAALRPDEAPEDLARRLRSDMGSAEDAARDRERSLWNAVDPDGTLTAATQNVKETAARVYDRLTRSGQLGVSSDEKAFSDLIHSFRPVESFSELKDLASQIKQATRDELRQRGRTPTYARLTQLNGAVRSSLENSAAERIAADPSVGARLKAHFDEWNAGQAGGDVGSAGREPVAVRAGEVPDLPRAAGAEGGRPGSAAGNARVPGQAKRGKALSLTQFIARNGGLPLDAESAARDFGSITVPGYGKLARPDGRPIDGYWRTKLIESGYLPPDADGYASRDITNELFRLLEEERAGRKSFSAADQPHLPPQEADGAGAELASNARMVRDVLKDAGIGEREVLGRAVDNAAEALARGDETDPLTAYERAVMALDEADVPARPAPALNEDRPSAGDLRDGFRQDPEAGKRYRAATEATRERVGTFGKGFAGQVLRQGEDRASFRMSDAAVASGAFRPGPQGAERIQSLVKAGTDRATLSDLAATSLHKDAVRNGVVDQARFEAWRKRHADALRELPEEVRARFANASLATQALERAAANRRAQIDAFNKSTLGKLAKVDPADLPKEIASILNAKDAAARTRALVQATAGDQAARDGLRQAFAEHITSRFVSNKEAAASGENAIKANAFASFVKDKAPALRQVFSGEELLRLQAIVDDIKRAERTLTAVKDPAGPGTAADLQAGLDKLARKAGEASLLTQIVVAGSAGFGVGGIKGAAIGTAGAVGKHVIGAARAAGMRNVDELVVQIMLDPALARAALAKAPAQGAGVAKAMERRLRQITPLAAVAGTDPGN